MRFCKWSSYTWWKGGDSRQQATFYFFNLQVISLFVDPPSALHSASMTDHTAAAWHSGRATLSSLGICSTLNKSSIRCLSARSFSLEKNIQGLPVWVCVHNHRTSYNYPLLSRRGTIVQWPLESLCCWKLSFFQWCISHHLGQSIQFSGNCVTWTDVTFMSHCHVRPFHFLNVVTM